MIFSFFVFFLFCFNSHQLHAKIRMLEATPNPTDDFENSRRQASQRGTDPIYDFALLPFFCSACACVARALHGPRVVPDDGLCASGHREYQHAVNQTDLPAERELAGEGEGKRGDACHLRRHVF